MSPSTLPVFARGSARRLAQKARVAANEMRADHRSAYAEVAALLAVAGAARALQRASWRTNPAASALLGRAPGTSAPWLASQAQRGASGAAARATGGTGSRQWRDHGGVNNQLNTPPERESVGDDLNAPLILALSDNIEVTHTNIGCDCGPSFTTNTSC